MFEVIESGNIVHIKANGKLIHEDYEQVIPKLGAIFEKYDKVRVCFEMTDFHGISPRAVWDDLKFDVKHGKQVERLAGIGNTAWKKWLMGMGRIVFHHAEYRYFDASDIDEAMDWLKEGAENARP